MTTAIAKALIDTRERARADAAVELAGRGYVQNEHDWSGQIVVGDHKVSARVALPDDFPDALPHVRVTRSLLPRRIPHVEADGKICLAPESGVLLDSSRPGAIVADSLIRAAASISAGLSGSNEQDFLSEFLAYWNHGASVLLHSVCNADDGSRVVYAFRVKRVGSQADLKVIADSETSARIWSNRLGASLVPEGEAFFARLESAFPPPDFDARLSVREIVRIIRERAGGSTGALDRWLQTSTLPATLILSVPLPAGSRAMAGIRLPAPRKVPGFRTGHAPRNWQLICGAHLAAERLKVDRVDPAFLLPRGGAPISLSDCTVVIAGCGSVGSRIAEHLAMLGVGKLRLVDHERLEPANVHRHVLGMDVIGANKAAALKTKLQLRFPHLAVVHCAKRVEEILIAETEFITETDLAVFALGDDTLGRRIDGLLHSHGTRRIHAWVEPIGIGQHVLAMANPAAPGCFECIFERTDEGALTNRAAFAEAGQDFQRSLAGCAGKFTPFSSIDADRAAIEAAELSGRILGGDAPENVLISRLGRRDPFLRAGFNLSPRASLFVEGEVRADNGFVRQDCPTCGQPS